MEFRELKPGGPRLSRIGFGTWAIGGPWEFGWGPANDAQFRNAIETAFESGINWIDTAPAYGLGHAEKIVGEVIQNRREDWFIATKAGLIWDDRGTVERNLHPRHLRRELEDSLRRLNTDYIDLYQFHWPDNAHPVEKSWELMTQFKTEGKVRFLGVSNFDVALMERCRKIHPIDSLQPPYNLLRREIETEILPYCLEHQIGVIGYSPMQSGLLTGRFDRTRLTADDWRHGHPMYTPPLLNLFLGFIEELRPIAAKYNKTVGQLAIRWVLSHPAITAAIVGARNPEQVTQNLGALDWTIDPSDLQQMDQLSAGFQQPSRHAKS